MYISVIELHTTKNGQANIHNHTYHIYFKCLSMKICMPKGLTRAMVAAEAPPGRHNPGSPLAMVLHGRALATSAAKLKDFLYTLED